jgi:hypothetical protein
MVAKDDLPKWHRPVAETGVPLFWLIFGVIAGAFGAVFSAAVDPHSETLRLYTTAASAGLGALGGAAATMFADRRKDKLAFRRKTKAAAIRIARVCLQIETIEKQAATFASVPVDRLEAALRAANPKQVMLIGLLLRNLADFGSSPPPFDEILETDDDVGNAMHAEELFKSFSYLAPLGNEAFPSYEASHASVTAILTSGMLKNLSGHRTTLQQIQAAFEQKLA